MSFSTHGATLQDKYSWKVEGGKLECSKRTLLPAENRKNELGFLERKARGKAVFDFCFKV